MSIIRIVTAGFLVCLLALTGCSCSTHPITSQTVVNKTLSALSSVKSYQLDTDFTDGTGTNSTEWKGIRVIDVSDKEMQMNLAITIGALLTTDEEYVMNGKDYLKTVAEANSPPTWGWSKSELDNDVWNAQIQIPFLTELLKTATQFSSLQTTQLNNVDCYILTVTPSAQASVDFLVTLDQPGGPDVGGVLWGGGGGTLDRTDTYNNGSVELWINKNSYLPVKVEVNVDFRGYLNPDNTNILEQGYQGELDFSNYNQPVSIQVPQDALNSPLQENVGTTVTSSGVTSQYKTYTLKHDNISFSFEYPVGYKIVNSDMQPNPLAALSVRFAHASGLFGWFSIDPVFNVIVGNTVAQQQYDLDSIASSAEGHTPADELDRESIFIAGAGTTGVMVDYTSKDYKNEPSVTREVFFVVNGVLWNICIYSSPAKANQAKLDIEHVINTFKVFQ